MKNARRWAVVQFPGSNCDQDTFRVFEELGKRTSGLEAIMHWHDEVIEPGQYQVIALPGGFSYGDYLRAGAIAKISLALSKLREVIEAGAHVIGICNGFQTLLETRLLPGYLQVNKQLRFISETVPLVIEREAFPWFKKNEVGKVVHFPIAHRFGNYQVSTIERGEMKVALRYQNDVNGSVDKIAGVYRILGKGTVFGLMPHPERASFADLRLTDGLSLWENAAESLAS